MNSVPIEWVAQATAGDQDALDRIVHAIQDGIYGLAMRMLGHPDDAADATQEILIKVMTHLGQFRGDSAVTTWVYRIAANHLLSARASRREQQTTSFQALDTLLEAGLALSGDDDGATPHEYALIEEMRISCTQGMLLCLDRPHRLAFILAVVFNLNSTEGAVILAISPAAFRQRLARARRMLRAFMERRCGLINPQAECQCHRQVGPAIQVGMLNPQQLAYASHPILSDAETTAARAEIVALGQIAGVFRSHPDYKSPTTYVEGIRRLLANTPLRLLQ
jgi:RNA polymerase sigma factor (sigma-70 family)